MLDAFGRVEDVQGMDCHQYYIEGRRGWVRIHEKSNKVVPMPCHHKLEEYLDEYVKVAELSDLPRNVPLLQTTRGRSEKLTGRRMTAVDVWRMVRKWTIAVGITSKIGNHSFRVTWITNYLQSAGENRDSIADG